MLGELSKLCAFVKNPAIDNVALGVGSSLRVRFSSPGSAVTTAASTRLDTNWVKSREAIARRIAVEGEDRRILMTNDILTRWDVQIWFDDRSARGRQ
jgi:hypothetical protein